MGIQHCLFVPPSQAWQNCLLTLQVMLTAAFLVTQPDYVAIKQVVALCTPTPLKAKFPERVQGRAPRVNSNIPVIIWAYSHGGHLLGLATVEDPGLGLVLQRSLLRRAPREVTGSGLFPQVFMFKIYQWIRYFPNIVTMLHLLKHYWLINMIQNNVL